jgi:hypothetical protein
LVTRACIAGVTRSGTHYRAGWDRCIKKRPTARSALKAAVAHKRRQRPVCAAGLQQDRTDRRGRSLSDRARHGDAAHHDGVALRTEDRERESAPGDALQADARAVEHETKGDDRAADP